MISRKHVASGLAATALLALSAIGAGAQSDDETIDIAVGNQGQHNVLSVTIDEVTDFPDVQYKLSDQTIEGDIKIVVTDERGTAEGWTFNLSGSDFTGQVGGSGDSFPIGGLSLTPGTVNTLLGNADVSGIHPLSIAAVHVAPGDQAISADNGSGNGKYEVTYAGDLVIPADTLVDTYTTTLTIEVPAAPST